MRKADVKLTPAAISYIKKIKEKPLKKKILSAIEEISLNPYDIGEPKKGDLTGVYGYDVKYKGSNYEMAYSIKENEDGELVIIILIGTRERFYESLKAYIKSSRILKK